MQTSDESAKGEVLAITNVTSQRNTFSIENQLNTSEDVLRDQRLKVCTRNHFPTGTRSQPA